MSAPRLVGHSPAGQAVHCWLVLVDGDLDLTILRRAAAAFPLCGEPVAESLVSRIAEQSNSLLIRAGLPASPTELQAAAQDLLSLGGHCWHCPALPWNPTAPEQAALGLDALLPLRLTHSAVVNIQPAAVALLLAVGAFDRHTPPLVRRLGTPASHRASGTIRLIPLAAVESVAWPSPGQMAGDGTDAECEAIRSRLSVPLRLIDAQTDAVAVITFDIDDQSPEDLAIGLDRVRAEPGVLSVTWTLGGAKKGRPSFGIEVLVKPAQTDQVILACLRETSTIGLRWRLEQRVLLGRQEVSVTTADARSGRVKTVTRPGGQCTAKAESDDVARGGRDWADRSGWRAELESRSRRQ